MELCRICLKRTSENDVIPLFNGGSLPHKIAAISSIKVLQEDNLPESICIGCALNVNLTFRFRSLIISNDFKLHRDAENLMTLESDLPEIIQQVDDDVPTNAKSVPEQIEDKRKYKCRKCDFQTNNYGEISRHRKNSHQSPVVCSICGKSILAANMRTHIISHYGTPVACTICGNIQKNSVSLRTHMLYHKCPPKVCHICGKSYTHSSVFAIHVRKHTTPQERKYHCNLCEKSFLDKKTLARHIRSHTGEKPYPCEYCKKGFSSSHALKTHIRQHTNETPFACTLCPMSFRQRVSLRTHLKSKHDEDKAS